jgi:uncharacterized membrane protein
VAEGRQPGIGRVVLVAGAIVAVVLGAAVMTGFLPAEVRGAIVHGPVLIAVLLVGTAWLLWRISHGRPIDGER